MSNNQNGAQGGNIANNSVYARGHGAMVTNNQGLPKIGQNGINNSALASSHAQMPQYSQ